MIDRRWTAYAIDTCIGHGIDHFFVAPGSRCTPLTLAIADHPKAQVIQHFDERALAFAALGYARGSDKPGVFICTSGTAVANAFPAVIEASMEAVPLLLFTADRPPELRGTGANQTIDQRMIFGNYVRSFVDLPVPMERLDDQTGFDFVHSELMRAFDHVRSGPVHLNWMFREPFGLEDLPDLAVSRQGDSEFSNETTDRSGCTIPISGDTLFVVGGCRPHEAQAVRLRADELGIPVLGDVTSGIRRISPEVGWRSNLPEPDTIVHIGQRIVSKNWLKYTAELKQTRFMHVTTNDLVINPNRLEVERVVTSISGARFQTGGRGTSAQFRDAWEQADEQRRMATAKVLAAESGQLSEPHLAYVLANQLRAGQGVYIGNSTPIRDLDWYGNWADDLDLMVGANRGASGIDGLVASGVGFAQGANRATTIVLGDLSALHDLNSLSLVAQSDVPIVVVVINNRGGGIFDLLPVAKSPHFERFFATPHTLDFRSVAEMFAIPYQAVGTIEDFESALERTFDAGESALIEARTDRKYGARIRERIRKELS